MADEIIIRYKADIDAFKSELEDLKKANNDFVNKVEGNQPKFEIKNVEQLKRALIDIGKASGEVLNMDEFRAEINNAVKDAKKLSEIKAEMERVASSVDSTTAEFRQLEAVIAGIDNEIAKIGEEAKKSGSDIKGAFGTVFQDLKSGFDLFKSGDLIGSFNAIKSGIQGITSASLSFIATPIGATIAALAGIGLATKEWLDFNIEVKKLNGEVEQLAGTTGQATDELRKNSNAISKVFGKEFGEAVKEQDQLMKQFGISSQESFKLYAEGLARGGARNEEFGDSIREYGVFFKKAGFSAGEFLNVLNTGVDLGVYTDKLPDAIKEFGLRISEGTKPAQDALTNAFGSEFTNKILGGVKNGTLSVKDSLVAISKEAEKAGLKTGQLAELTSALGGGPAEDLGGIENLFKAINQSQELATKGLTAYEQGLVNSAMKAKELEDAKDKAFKSDSAIAFIKTLENLWTDLQIAFFDTIAALRPVFEFIGKTFESIFLQIKTNIQLVSKIFSGDFKGAVELVKGYFNSLNYIWDGVIDKMKIKISEGLLYIVKKVKPVFDALGISTDNIIKSLERSITESSRNIDKIKQKKAGELAATKAQIKAEEDAKAKAIADAEAKAKAERDAKAKADAKAKRDANLKAIEDAKKEAEKIEKEKNDSILKERDAALKKISDLEIRKQKELIAELEATGAPKNRIEEEKIKLLEAEQKYNNQILAVRSSFANQLASKYTDTKQKELDAIVEGNKRILEEESKIRNERTKLEIQQAISAPDDNTARLERLKKNLQDETTLTVEEANKKKIALLKIEEEILLSKMLFNDKQINDLLASGAAYEGEMVQSRLKANEELNQKLIDANKARLKEEERQEKEALDKKKAQLKAQLDSIFEFASNGLLLQIGIDPQALAKTKSDIENAYKALQKGSGATDQEKALAVTQAAQSAVVMGIDAIRNAERQAAEEKLAEIAIQEEAELKSAEGNEQKQAIIRQKYDAKRKEVKRKEFEADKRASIIKATIETALAVLKAAPNPILMALAATIGAAQIGIIASAPIPKFEKGGLVGKPISDGLLSGKPHSAGGVLLEAEGNEFIVNKKSTKKYLPLLEAINDDALKSHYILPEIQAKEQEIKQQSEKRITDIQNTIIQSTIAETLKQMRKDNNVNTEKIVSTIKKDNYKL